MNSHNSKEATPTLTGRAEGESSMDWKTLKSEYIFKRPWLTARRDTCQLPDGRINDEYYVLEYPTWVHVVAVTKDGEMVIIRQYRHGLGRTCFEIVAGCVEEGEDPLEAAKRELLEETGYSGGEWHEAMQFSCNASTMNNITHSYVAVGVEKTADQYLDATEDIEIHAFSQEKVKEMLLNGEFMQASMLAALYKFFSFQSYTSSSSLNTGYASEPSGRLTNCLYNETISYINSFRISPTSKILLT